MTPFQAEMGDAGSGHFRMQAAVIRATAGAGFEDAGPLKPIIDLIIKVIEWLKFIATGQSSEPPASSEESRSIAAGLLSSAAVRAWLPG